VSDDVLVFLKEWKDKDWWEFREYKCEENKT